MHDIFDVDYLADLLPREPDVHLIVRNVLGDNLRLNVSTRGAFAIFPTLTQ